MRCAGLLIAGGLHQEALNFLVYYEQRRLFKPALPYLSLPDVDMDSDHYIKWFTQKRDGNNPTIQRYLEETPYWEHAYMMLALIKYERIQELCIERKKVDAKVMSFLMGTHPRVGCESPVRVMRGSIYAIRAITDLFCKTFKSRITNLIQQVNTLLKTVHKCRNNLIIPHLHCEPLPEKPKLTGAEGLLPDDLQDKILNNLHDIKEAEWAFEYYACGWNQHQYRYVLEDFLKEGTVQRDWMIPNNRAHREGYQEANYDVDPSAGIQACSRYSFRCFLTPKSDSLDHFCTSDHFKEAVKQGLKASRENEEKFQARFKNMVL